VGIDPFTPGFLLTLLAVVAASSFGVAGVGGGATYAAILVLSVLDLPVGLAGLLISVEPLIDMGRTAVNVSGSMTAGVLTARFTRGLDADLYAGPSTGVGVTHVCPCGAPPATRHRPAGACRTCSRCRFASVRWRFVPAASRSWTQLEEFATPVA